MIVFSGFYLVAGVGAVHSCLKTLFISMTSGLITMTEIKWLCKVIHELFRTCFGGICTHDFEAITLLIWASHAHNINTYLATV